MKKDMKRSEDMGVRNGKHYLMGVFLVALTSVITLWISDVARTVKDAPVNNAIQAGEIKLLYQQIEVVEQNLLKMERSQEEFKKTVAEEFDELRDTNASILSEVRKVSEAMRAHVH